MNPLSFFFVNLVDRAVAEILALFASFNKSYFFCNLSKMSYAPTVLYRTCHADGRGACVSLFSLRLWVWSFGVAYLGTSSLDSSPISFFLLLLLILSIKFHRFYRHPVGIPVSLTLFHYRNSLQRNLFKHTTSYCTWI
jgi:hypothetical protein